jgi:3'(2'), 5'-bisphosphate nucleotidase
MGVTEQGSVAPAGAASRFVADTPWGQGLKGAAFDLREIEGVIAQAAIVAGREIMSATGEQRRPFSKTDGSPVTGADLQAEKVIRERIGMVAPGLTVIGEEGGLPDRDKALPRLFALVDPLDGTRDFLAGSPEFTVNIALIEGGRAVTGVVHAPALGRLFIGNQSGAWEISANVVRADLSLAPRRRLRVRAVPDDGPVALDSRSHREAATEAALAIVQPAARRAIGSSLKFALVAAGEADIYVRGIGLNEWDIAAGDAVLSAAGGAVLTFKGQRLRYGRAAHGMRTPPFVAIGDRNLRKRLAGLTR